MNVYWSNFTEDSVLHYYEINLVLYTLCNYSKYIDLGGKKQKNYEVHFWIFTFNMFGKGYQTSWKMNMVDSGVKGFN